MGRHLIQRGDTTAVGKLPYSLSLALANLSASGRRDNKSNQGLKEGQPIDRETLDR